MRKLLGCKLGNGVANSSQKQISLVQFLRRHVGAEKQMFEGGDVGKNSHRENSITQVPPRVDAPLADSCLKVMVHGWRTGGAIIK
uniref:Uncharacterized protein n=1 Tax=Aeromonas salmonicida subsp. salmonicida TaxID=29491 RepID=A0A0F6QD89_AERSS|nr:hypothetical protein [Aeromonas salmonicida subsp. salmonicida]